MSPSPENISAAPTVVEALAYDDSFALRVLSPSTGATEPLSIRVTTTNTVKDLKQKIRDALPIQPSDERQRLIYQGRALSREEETMLEVFGQDRIKNTSEIQTVHLVLREPPTYILSHNHDHQPVITNGNNSNSQSASAAHGPGPTITSPRPIVPPGITPPSVVPFPHISPLQQLRELEERQRLVDRLRQRRGEELPATAFENSQLGGLAQQTRELQAEAIRARQTLIGQRQRAGIGAQGIQPPHVRLSTPSRSVTYTQSGIGPNGERWNATVTETTTTVTTNVPQGSTMYQHPQANPGTQDIVQAILNGAERGRNGQHVDSQALPASDAIPVMTAAEALQINTPNLNRTSMDPPEQPQPNTGATSVVVGEPGDTPNAQTNDMSLDSRTPTPNLMPTTISAQQLSSNVAVPSSTAGPLGPTVYILSSPSGPQALLIAPSQNGLESFFTPLQSPSRHSGHRGPVADIDAANRRDRRRLRHARHNNPAAAAPVVAGGAPAIQLGHPHNPNAGAAMVQLWPHLWLVIRLMGFVWFFTSGSASWWRTIMVSSVAFVVFLYNTGIFNGIAARVWDPVRGHLEALLPLAGPEPAPGPGENANPNPPAGEAVLPGRGVAPRAPTPDPAQVAARLLEERRRADGNWLWTQFRRVEHATLLFLASLIPGVGERHIAARVAEENIAMEVDRQREAAQAAALAASAATEGGAGEGGAGEGVRDAHPFAENEENGEAPVHREGNVEENHDAQAARLVDV